MPFLSGFRGHIDQVASVSPEAPKNENKVYQKKDVGEDQNSVIAIASEISGNDIDWIATVEAENGLWDMYRKHPNINSNGTWDYSCGLNSKYHWPFIEKILAKEVTEKQILTYCYEVYNKRHGAFYGYYRREPLKNRFYLQ